MGACRDGLKRFIKQTGGNSKSVDVISLIGGENTVSDLLWLAGKTLPKEKIVKFACKCALISIDLIKPYCSEPDFKLVAHFLDGSAAANTANTARTAAIGIIDVCCNNNDDDAYLAANATYSACTAQLALGSLVDAIANDAYLAAVHIDSANATEKINGLLIDLFKGD
ncbi:conserved hypothetical protein [Vibrio phage 236O40-1]|nr:conserved hypothetical protein [Vibrio phage 236O40-1]